MLRSLKWRILGASLLIFSIILMAGIAHLIGAANAQSPPAEPIDPAMVALVQALNQASGRSDWTGETILGTIITVVGASATFLLRNGIPLRLAEEDRSLLKDVAGSIEKIVNHRDLLVKIETKMESHSTEIAELRELRHELPNKLQPLQSAIDRVQVLLEERERDRDRDRNPVPMRRG